MKYIVNLSGGKDSTAMLLMLLEKACPIDYIIFADTGKDFPQMRTHIERLGEYIKEHYPAAPEIITLKADVSFDYLMFEHIKTKGKRQGKAGYGWATMWCRWCTTTLKQQVINKFCRTLSEPCINYIGIAADEPKRLAKKTKGNTFPLPIGILRKPPLSRIATNAGLIGAGYTNILTACRVGVARSKTCGN